uniref:Uncharacterized protein n=1 Tax=Anopheles atroparvus TaxID=41427 RepID=A0AAG5CMV3_ANOAO
MIDPIVPNDAKEEGNDNLEQIETVAIEEEQLDVEDMMKTVNSSDEEIQIESQLVNVMPVVLARKRKDPIARITEMKAKLMKRGPPVSRIEEKRLTIQMRHGPDATKPRSVCDKVAQIQPQHPTTTVAEYQTPTTLNQGLKPAQKSPATSSTKTVQRKSEAPTNEKSDDVSPLKRDQISEFIFRGEEFVQMPKAVYERQIEGLKRKVARYENILLTMRDVMDEANFDDSFDS